MPDIFDAISYPFHLPEAQQLHAVLMPLYPTVASAVLAAQRSGLDTYEIYTEQSVSMVWSEVLRQATAQGLLRKLITDIHGRTNASSPAQAFFEKILRGRTFATEPTMATDREGATIFLKGSNTISEPEALLYKDDLSIQIGKVRGLINTLETLLFYSPSVCKLSADFNGQQLSGTGFRISAAYLLTNWHVLHHPQTGVAANAVNAEFGYEDDGAGGFAAGRNLRCDSRSILTSRSDDWAIIKVEEPMDEAWPIIDLHSAMEPATTSSAYIIQHPLGERKRLAFVRNQVSGFNERTVHYLTDTSQGSSGAPVFNEAGKLIALHRAGGIPQEVTGKPPIVKNEGIRIARIVAGLQAEGFTVA
jgi:V8-like Glu-specific endopeptidase